MITAVSSSNTYSPLSRTCGPLSDTAVYHWRLLHGGGSLHIVSVPTATSGCLHRVKIYTSLFRRVMDLDNGSLCISSIGN